MAGAVTLFETMEATYCMPYILREIKCATLGHPIAEAMFIFSFAYLVEGASGFGTPVALGAPMLVSTGHGALESVVTLLIFNTFATVWGAVGTPIWFGLGEVVPQSDFLPISQRAAVALAIGAMILMPWILTILVPWKMVKDNLVFVYCATVGTVGPSLAIAFVSFEFPSLMGGLIGCFVTTLLVRWKVGLRPVTEDHEVDLGRNVEDISTVSSVRGIVRKYQKSTSNESDMTSSNDVIFHDAASQHNDKETGDEALTMTKEPNSDLEQNGAFEISKTESTPTPDGRLVFDRMPSNMPTLAETIEEHLGPRKSWKDGYLKESLLRSFPLWAVVLILILTRVSQIGIKPYLTKTTPSFAIYFGTYGTFRLSAALVFQLQNILTYPNLNWSFALLYVPFLLPFVFVSLITLVIFRKDLHEPPSAIARTVGGRLASPAIALMGALVLVQLMIRSGASAPANVLGTILSGWFQQGFVVLSPLIGALGSFFSGSTTVSNLTFGEIQQIAAEQIGTSMTAMLALQTVGGSAGNGVCLNNIIAANAVVGLNVGEGKILGQTYKYVLSLTTIATVVMLVFFFRFS